MPIVAGVDFGTLSVRVTLLDSDTDSSGKVRGRLGTATRSIRCIAAAKIPTTPRSRTTTRWTRSSKPCAHALDETAVRGGDVDAIALDTTGSSVIPVDAAMQPLDEYYLWCDHRAKNEAQQITALAHAENLEAIEWCGGVYSHEWGFAKLLHWLRHNPEKRAALRHRIRALRHGRRDALRHHRSRSR